MRIVAGFSYAQRLSGSFALMAIFTLWALSAVRPPDFIEGVWSDVCPCSIPCSCWHTHRSNAPRCLNFHVFKVIHGMYGGTDLSGATFVLLNLPASAFQAPSPRTLFIDQGLSEQKAIAIEGLIGKYFGPTHTRRAPIDFREHSSRQEVTIPGILSFGISLDSSLDLSDQVSEDLYPWLFNPKQGIAYHVSYLPLGQEPIRYSGTNAISASFRILVTD